MTTPAQLAKDFARDNGFMIKPVERRYHVMRAGMPLTFVADVGGYPAALNAMRRYLERDAVGADQTTGLIAADADELCAGGSLVLPKPGDGPVMLADAQKTDESIAWLERVVPASELLSPIAILDLEPRPTLYESNMQRAIVQNAELVDRAAGRLGIGLSFGPRDVENGQIMRGVLHNIETGESRPFDDAPRWTHKGDSTPRAAHYVVPSERTPPAAEWKASVLVSPRRPFHLEWKQETDGQRYFTLHATRADALKAARRMMGNKRMRPVWINIAYLGA